VTDETTPPSTGPGGTGGDGAATAPPTGEDAEAQVTARRLRELQKTTGHLREATEQHGEQLASVGEQLQELGEQVAQTSARHTDLAAAVSEDLAPRVSGLQQVFTVDTAGGRSADEATVEETSLTVSQATRQAEVIAEMRAELDARAGAVAGAPLPRAADPDDKDLDLGASRDDIDARTDVDQGQGLST
jgi:hypothetical protein